LATLQHAVVARWQLIEVGFTRTVIADLVRSGHLHPLYRGVYAVGHVKVSRQGRWMAAVLACGREAVLSHQSAVALWDLRPVATGPMHVTDPRGSRHGRKGIHVHRPRALDGRDFAVCDHIPVTSIARTLLDYAATAHPQQVRLAVEAAERKGLFDGRAVDDLLARSRGHAGAKPLKSALLEVRGPVPWTRSELERRFLALIREAGLPEPQANVSVAGENVDYFWPGPRVVVEVDGYEWHKSRRQFEKDRIKDTRLQLAACWVLRATQPRIQFEPKRLLGDLAAMLRNPRGGLASGP
jgi:very-short-patch-repair endonuclease